MIRSTSYTVVENELNGPNDIDFGFIQIVEYDVKMFGYRVATVVHFYYAEFCKTFVGPKPGKWVVDKRDIVETMGICKIENGKYMFEVNALDGGTRLLIADPDGSGGFDFLSTDGTVGGYFDPRSPDIDDVPECP